MKPAVTAKKPGRPPEPEHCARRREEILDAAVRLFAEHGFTNTDMQVLADTVQVGKGTLYRYFPSKRDLFLAATDQIMSKVRQSVDAAIAGIDDPLERIRVAIGAFLRFFADHPEYVELLIQERANFKDRTKPTYYQHVEVNVVRWQAIYRSLMAEGRVRQMPVERITDVMSDLIYGTLFNNYFAGRDKSPEDQAQAILDIVFRGILTAPEQQKRAGL
jgi:AcrR family transcriptional regulator